MRLLRLGSTIAFPTTVFFVAISGAQVANNSDQNPVRVTVTLNADGSRTSYEFDTAHKKATAVTTAQDGKVREKIKYDLDDSGRFSSAVVSDAGGQFRFKSTYKYDAAGRLEEETHLGKNNAVINKLVYQYDAAGKQTGYSIFDASGKLVGKTSAASPSPTPRSKPR
jgi:YD repeat-containing protein